MWPSKAKQGPAKEMSQSEGAKVVLDNPPRSDLDEPQYPGVKVVILTTISVILAVFLVSLVGVLSSLANIVLQSLIILLG